MHHVRQENLPFVGSSHEFVGTEQGDTGVSVFLFHGKPAPGRVRIAILMTRSNSSAKAAECGRSTASPSRAALEISLSSKRARSTASRRLVILRWCKSMCT
jgi:hypothetical protein